MRIDLSSQNFADVTFYDERRRDLLLICPGGGYEFTSKREAVPVAHCFGSEGYHTAIYYYRETKLVYPDTINEAKDLIEKLSALPIVKRIIVIGFSAGGHLAASMAIECHKQVKGSILAYPVITSNIRYRHPGSFLNLLGGNLTNQRVEDVSLEKHVHEKMGPVFLFHTMDDASVPVENSMIFLGALRMKRVPAEGHFFASGRHGVSLATEDVPFDDMNPSDFVRAYGHLNEWVRLAKAWLKTL